MAKKKPRSKTTVITVVDLPNELVLECRAQAKLEGMSFNRWVNDAIKRFVEKHEAAQAA